jgi:hypothetical protein
MLVTIYCSFPVAKITAYAKWYRNFMFEQAKRKAELREYQKIKGTLRSLKQMPFSQLRGIVQG